MFKTSRVDSSRTVSFILSGAFAGLLLLSGCESSNRAEVAPPPPETLSVPIRYTAETEAPPASRAAVQPLPVSVAPVAQPAPPAAPIAPPNAAPIDEYANQKPGESKELPQFLPPPPEPAPAAPVPPPVETSAAPAAPAARSVRAPGAHAEQSSNEMRYHTLAKGETIYSISRLYNVKPKQILSANQFKDPNKLPVGTKVVIPNY